MIQSYRLAAEKCNYPLHLGVTEAGTERMGLIKSAIGIGSLLCDGIGETIRVSLTDNPVKEIEAAKDILKCIGKRKGVQFVSCPTCGRTRIDLVKAANEVENALKDIDKDIKVAVMGCVVNGPGEAREADIGIAGGDGCAVISSLFVIAQCSNFQSVPSSVGITDSSFRSPKYCRRFRLFHYKFLKKCFLSIEVKDDTFLGTHLRVGDFVPQFSYLNHPDATRWFF